MATEVAAAIAIGAAVRFMLALDDGADIMARLLGKVVNRAKETRKILEKVDRL